MLGKLIVALLVVASAAFVMLQKRDGETKEIAATISEQRADESARRAAAREQELAALQKSVADLQAKLAWQEARFAELAEDCTPAAEPEADVEMVGFQRRAPDGDLVGQGGLGADHRADQRWALVLRGEAAEVSRVRIYPGLDDGAAVPGGLACDTLGADNASFLAVATAGQQLVGASGPQRIPKKAGTVSYDLRCDVEIDPAYSVVVEVVVSGLGPLRTVLAPEVQALPMPSTETLSPVSVAQAMRGAGPKISDCVRRWRDAPSGKQQLRLDVRPSGLVVAARFIDPEVNGTAAGRCVAQSARTWRFGTFDGGNRTVDVPLVLRSE